MARTQAIDFDSKRAAIMKQAAGLFAEKGFNGASIADISKACGVSKSLIYHYYTAKEDILFDVMNNHIKELVEVISNTTLYHENPREEFRQMTLAILNSYSGAEDEQKVLLYELNNLKATQRSEIVEKQRLIIDTFENTYKKIFPELENNKALLRSKIMLFFGMINWTHNWYSPEGTISRDSLAEIAARIMS